MDGPVLFEWRCKRSEGMEIPRSTFILRWLNSKPVLRPRKRDDDKNIRPFWHLCTPPSPSTWVPRLTVSGWVPSLSPSYRPESKVPDESSKHSQNPVNLFVVVERLGPNIENQSFENLSYQVYVYREVRRVYKTLIE